MVVRTSLSLFDFGQCSWLQSQCLTIEKAIDSVLFFWWLHHYFWRLTHDMFFLKLHFWWSISFFDAYINPYFFMVKPLFFDVDTPRHWHIWSWASFPRFEVARNRYSNTPKKDAEHSDVPPKFEIRTWSMSLFFLGFVYFSFSPTAEDNGVFSPE